MKYLKNKNISKFSISDNTFIAYTRPQGHTTDGSRAIMDLTGGLRLPKGTTNQRPETTGVRTPNGGNGFIRYNTDNDPLTGNPIGLEALIEGTWTTVRAPGSTTITKKTYGPGDDVEHIFGPLDTVRSGTSYLASEDNIIVLVENVMQISTTNFEVLSNPCNVTGNILAFDATFKTITSSNTSVINFETAKFVQGQSIVVSGSGLNDGTYTIASRSASTITTVEALSDEAAGATVQIYGLSSATGYLSGSAYKDEPGSGYWLIFDEPVPLNKNVTVYFGYAD